MIKRYAAEFLGTFGIVFAPVAAAACSKVAGVDHGLLVAALASGLPVLAMIYTFGPISAAHFNPAVTLGFALAKRFPWKFVVPYWIAQIARFHRRCRARRCSFHARPRIACAARSNCPPAQHWHRSDPHFSAHAGHHGLATDKRVSGSVPAIGIGFIVVVDVLIGGPITGGSMNPARSFGSAVFTGGQALASYWLYVVGPMIGACLAALIYEAVRLDKDQAKGAPDLFPNTP